MTPSEDFFDEAFLEELRQLAETVTPAEEEDEDDVPVPPSGPQQAALAGFLESSAGPLSEDGLVEEPAYAFTQRVNRLIESCRHSDRRSAVEAVESFLVFVQTLVPSLPPPGAQVRARRSQWSQRPRRPSSPSSSAASSASAAAARAWSRSRSRAVRIRPKPAPQTRIMRAIQ